MQMFRFLLAFISASAYGAVSYPAKPTKGTPQELPQCFDSSEQHSRAADKPEIVMNMRNWASHEIMTYIVTILIKEKLGHDAK
eukprot:2679136-Prymnesium_polylepis.1